MIIMAAVFFLNAIWEIKDEPKPISFINQTH